jgi:hypothetical protein
MTTMPPASHCAAAADLSLIADMERRGVRAAVHRGRQLVWWGTAAALLLAVQYVAEVRDWAPSRLLWWWQPPFLLGAALSLRTLFRFPGGRIRSSAITRAYVAGFAAAFLTLAAYLVGSGAATGHPVPFTTVLVLTAVLGCAMVAIGASSRLYALTIGGIGWWLLLLWFASRGRLVTTDFLVLAAAMLGLLAGPGLALGRPWHTPRARAESDGTP